VCKGKTPGGVAKVRVLVGYASYHCSTAEIAERIADVLWHEGVATDMMPISQAGDPDGSL
jgi:menaquinone-dependent protoporphyrinogen IX oxidase